MDNFVPLPEKYQTLEGWTVMIKVDYVKGSPVIGGLNIVPDKNVTSQGLPVAKLRSLNLHRAFDEIVKDAKKFLKGGKEQQEGFAHLIARNYSQEQIIKSYKTIVGQGKLSEEYYAYVALVYEQAKIAGLNPAEEVVKWCKSLGKSITQRTAEKHIQRAVDRGYLEGTSRAKVTGSISERGHDVIQYNLLMSLGKDDASKGFKVGR
jgi:hypothetical protein